MTRTGDPEAITLSPSDLAVPKTVYGAEVPQDESDDPIYDKTQLSLHEGFRFMRIHRDYLAHAIRFEFIVQRLRQAKGTAVILDVGCGDIPLMRALDSGMSRPRLYVGVDVRRKLIENRRAFFRERNSTFPMELIALDFTEAPEALLKLPYTHVVCLEVIEHMPRGRGLMLLDNLRRAAAPNGSVFLSTPCFDNVQKAGHHIFEWTRDDLRTEIGKRFEIMNNWGTFSSVRELQRALTPAEREVWLKLSSYYGAVAKSLIFSPLHPEVARNNVWELMPR